MTLTTRYYILIESLRSLRYWLPIIWNDRHWDHVFIFILLQHKLKGVKKNLKGGFIGADREIRKIEVVLLLLDRIIAENYDGANYNIEIRLIQRDVDYLFHILSKHIRKWWT